MTTDYNEHAVRSALRELPRSWHRPSVLVVGANTGSDCRRFIELGAGRVTGLDPMPDVGRDFSHPRVSYYCSPIEECLFQDQSFDLVFCFATLEHVGDIVGAISQMARLTKPGGVIYCLASPLWRSPQGHHMSCFGAHPWVHLLYPDRENLVAFSRQQGIDGERGHSIEGIAAYIFDTDAFNRRGSAEYIAAAAALAPHFDLRSNKLVLEDSAMLDHPNAIELMRRGYSGDDLLAVTHMLIAQSSPSVGTRLYRRARRVLSSLLR